MAYTKDLARKAAAERDLVDVPPEPLKPHIIRMTDTQWRQLTLYFRSKGLGVAAGVRQALHEWMDTQ